LNVRRTKKTLLVVGSVLAAAAVGVSGMIGFVGLMVPHLARLVVGAGHRRLVPASALAGGLLLLWADTLARTAREPVEVPVGIVTALLGAPFFLFLLRRAHGARRLP
ncbi:iron chelate uptake ABC transporter family permease subunit, partial [bacterium]|nr:iron chelate uptake ABC transporter family permease subunit [bacterium]